MGERCEVAHPVKVNLAHQVVEFMLDDASEESFGRNLNLPALTIQGIDSQFAPSGNKAAEIGNTQTAFPILDEFLIEDGDIRIHEYRHWNVAARPVAFENGQRERFMNLRSSESNPVVL